MAEISTGRFSRTKSGEKFTGHDESGTVKPFWGILYNSDGERLKVKNYHIYGYSAVEFWTPDEMSRVADLINSSGMSWN